jgi:hypothetical protein
MPQENVELFRQILDGYRRDIEPILGTVPPEAE